MLYKTKLGEIQNQKFEHDNLLWAMDKLLLLYKC